MPDPFKFLSKPRMAIWAIPLLVHLWAISVIPLFCDEAYYWEWSRHLALSYFDHPPMVAYAIALSIRLFGKSGFAVHLPATVCAFITSIILYRLAKYLSPSREERERLALGTVLLFNCAPLFAMGSVYTTPDAPCAVFWMATVYFLRRALLRDDAWPWYLAGATAGMGMLSKYNMVLLLPAVGLYTLTSDHRRWLKRKEPYLALGVTTLFFLPVIIWNAQHHWASFAFHLVERHRRSFTPLINVGRFFAAQMTLSPPLFAASTAALFRSYRKGRAGDDVHWFLFWCSASTVLFFAGVGIFALTLPNWPALGYITLLISVADFFTTRHRLWERVTWMTAGAMSLLFYLHNAYNVFPLPLNMDFAIEPLGWEEAGKKIEEIRNSNPHPERVFVFSRRYQASALAAFYWNPQYQVTRFSPRQDAYDDWASRQTFQGRDAVFFCDDRFFSDPSEFSFQSCDKKEELVVEVRGKKVKTFYFWMCHHFEG